MATEKDTNSLEGKFRAIAQTVDAANALTEPLVESIENLLRLAGNSLKCEEVSVLIREGEQGDLRFLSAVGKVADQLVGMKIPAGKGIAGFVFSSGQPMAIADVGQEQSFYAEVDKKTGYETQTLLATPLRHKDQVIGVLEFVNRTGEQPFEPFTPFEMDKAALFAEALSSLVSAYESAKLFRELGGKMLEKEGEAEFSEIRDWLKDLRASAEHREMLDLAVLVREIAAKGDAERILCREILESILRCSDNKSGTEFYNY